MSTHFLFTNQEHRTLPAGVDTCSRAAYQLNSLINAHIQERATRTVLKMEGEANGSVYFVLSGWMCVSKSMMDGHRQIVDIVLQGGVLEPGSADSKTSAVEIEALTDVTYAAVPRETWLRFAKNNPELGDVLLREIGATTARIYERMLRLGKGDAESIVAFALCELCLRSTGMGLLEVKEFQIPMTQQQLGDLCGLSSVHICRTLRRLRRKGILDVRNHMDVTIHDVVALAETAEIDPDGLRLKIVTRSALPPLKNCS